MSTTTIDLDAFLRLYLNPAHSTASIADALRVPLHHLLDFLNTPRVAHACAALAAFHRERLPILTSVGIEKVLRDLVSLPPAAEHPSDLDRHRKATDSLRRAAEGLAKLCIGSGPRSARLPETARDAARPALTSEPQPLLPSRLDSPPITTPAALSRLLAAAPGPPASRHAKPAAKLALSAGAPAMVQPGTS